jgi:hypothetical protein
VTPAALFVALVLVAAAQPGANSTDPLAPARLGQLQCYTPNIAKKTCHALAQYVWAADGSIQNPAEVMIEENPLVVMKGSAPVVVRSGAVCGPFRAEDIQQATFTIAGNPAPPQLANQIRTQLLMASTDRLGKDICTTYVPDKGEYTAQITIDGVAHPELSDRMIWVKPDDGFKVGP